MPDKLKKGWKRVAFGDVVRQVRDRVNPEDTELERYVAGEHMNTDDLRIRRWGLIGDGYLGPAFNMRFSPGQVLYGSRRTYLRKVAVADFEGITANTTFVIETKDPKVLLPKLLPFIMQTESFHEHSIKQSKGSVNPYINFSDLTWYEFALPPLEEQRRIAEVLRAMEVQHEALTRSFQAAVTLEKTIFAHALRGSLHNHRGSLRQSVFGMVPVEWDVVPISSIAKVAYGISEAVASNKDPSIGWPILTGANITLAGTLNLSKIVYIKEPKKEDFILKPGDLLLNWRSGSEEHVGKTAIFDLNANYTYASFVLRIRTDDKTNRMFLWRLLNHMREFRLFGTSTSQQINFKMNAAMFREVEVVVPPREIQDGIVTHLRGLWKAQAAIRKRKDKTKSLSNKMIEGIV
jgi:type I restriction enzyme S subunit